MSLMPRTMRVWTTTQGLQRTCARANQARTRPAYPCCLWGNVINLNTTRPALETHVEKHLVARGYFRLLWLKGRKGEQWLMVMLSRESNPSSLKHTHHQVEGKLHMLEPPRFKTTPPLTTSPASKKKSKFMPSCPRRAAWHGEISREWRVKSPSHEMFSSRRRKRRTSPVRVS